MLKEFVKNLTKYRGNVGLKSVEASPVNATRPIPSLETSNLMRRIKNSRAMLTIRVDGSDNIYLSALLEVNESSGYIVLDELNSKAGHRALCLVKQIEISTRIEGREIKFSCNVTGIGEKDGISYYKVPFPESLDQQLRRKHLRIPAPRGKYLQVHIHTELKDLVIGELSDLSIGGFGAILNRETSNKVTRGDIVPKCMLYLGETDPIQTELDIRYCEDKRYHSSPRLGGKFLNLDQNTERRLQKYISQLDRLKTRSQTSA